MSTAIVRKMPMLARRIQRFAPCRCVQTSVRLRSTLSAATIPAEWDTSTSPSYSHHLPQPLPQQPLPQQQLQDQQHHALSSLDLFTSPSTCLKDADPIPSKPKTKKEDLSQVDNTVKEADNTLHTYQGHALLTNRRYFPELEPAPFPRDIHSSMPYMNRHVSKPTTTLHGIAGQVHNDLQSFEELEHNLDSTIYRGTRFEYQTQEILRKTLGIYTQRSAGTGDLGVDLRGTWFLPLSASPKPGDMVRHLKVIVQCKTMASKIGPKFVRELQGSLSFETQPTMAILAVSSDYTKQALLPYTKSVWPMALVVIDTETEVCSKLMWNTAAEEVMHGLQVGTMWMPGQDGSLKNQPVLCFEGKVLERLPGPYLSGEEDSTNDGVKARVVEYEIPDWKINTTPGCIHLFPEVVEEASSSPPQSSYLELLTWHAPSLPPLEQLNESLS